nr:putative methyltransferase family protein [Tanacetum cinerariifolium]
MLRWICGKTMVDMIPNEVFKAKIDVDSIIDKMREGRLRWFGHVKRRPKTAIVRRVEAMLVEGSRRRGRPKLRWEDRLKQGMNELLLSEDMTSDRNACLFVGLGGKARQTNGGDQKDYVVGDEAVHERGHMVKEKQENDKIRTKPDKNGKRGKDQQCRRPIT